MAESMQVGDFRIRPFQSSSDLPAVKRIWRECGWGLEAEENYIDDFCAVGDGYVAALDGTAECFCHSAQGELRYQDDELQLMAITAVLTSQAARQRGLATALTTHAIAKAVASRGEVAVLRFFDQGFYDRLGFGAGSYDQLFNFAPADLKALSGHRVPRRLTKADWSAMNHALQNRWPSHGSCVLHPPEVIKAEAGLHAESLGFGYFDDAGELTHFFYGKLDGQNGPLRIAAMSYQNGEQLRELFSLLRTLEDQVSQIVMFEPAHLQLQDWLEQPIRARRLSKGGSYESAHHAGAHWQVRILNLEACLAKTHLYGPGVEFNLELSDPLDRVPAAGITGTYKIEFGEDSTATKGSDPALPTMRASVDAFTRLWLGVRPATELAITNELSASQSLLKELDNAIRLPAVKLGWQF